MKDLNYFQKNNGQLLKQNHIYTYVYKNKYLT